MKLRGFQFTPRMKILMYGSFSLLFLTGVTWLVLHYFFRTETEFNVQNSKFEPIVLTIHGFLVPIFLTVFGAIFPTHIYRAYKAKRNLFSGVLLLSIFVLLIFSGYLLYYSGVDAFRNYSSVVHSILGISTLPTLLMHIFKGRKLNPLG